MTHPVALVHDWLTGQRGGENVLAEMAKLFPGAPIYTLFHFPGSVSAEIEAHPIVPSFLQRAPGLDPWYRYYLPLFPAAIEDLPVGDHRLVLSTSHCVAKGARAAPGAVHVCYCHTPMRYAWDQEEAYFGRARGPVGRLRAAILARLRHWDVATANRVHHYLANSSFVAGRIRSFYGRSAQVLPPPVDTEFFTPREGPRQGPVVLVAALAPYKKVDRAIQACERLGIPLAVVGEGPERKRLEALAGPSTRLLGRVDGEVLRELYRSAICFLQPGIEDFGIATVEALACGAPVVALRQGGVLDIVQDGEQGMLFDDPSVEGIAAAIDKTRRMQFNSMNLRGRAEIFSAPRFARRLKELIISYWPEAEGLLA